MPIRNIAIPFVELNLPIGIKRSSGTPFVPTSIAGLREWLKAYSLVLNNNDPVTTWADNSGLGNNATGGSGLTYKTNIQNSLPAVLCSSATITLPLSLPAGSWSFYFVLNPTDIAGDRWLHDSTLDRLITTAYSAGAGAKWHDVAAWSSGGAVSTGWQILDFRLPAGGTGKIEVNGSAVATSAYTASRIGGTGVRLFSAEDGVSNPFVGYCGEFLLYDTALSDANHAKVMSYLNSKWAIY